MTYGGDSSAGTPRERRKGSTMRDVAAYADVSAQTVSNFINGRYEHVGKETRRRIETALKELDYVVDHRARNLRQGLTQTLGFLVLDEHLRFLSDPLTALVLAGIGDVARDRNYGILIQAVRPSTQASELLAPIFERRVDGALLVLSGHRDLRAWYLEQLAEREHPFVVFDEPTDAPTGISIMAENRHGAKLLTEHLIAQGHTRIAYIAARVPWPVVEQRYAGFRQALSDAGIKPVLDLELFEGGFEISGGVQMANKLLDRPDPPTAIVASSDLLAVGAVQATRNRSLRIPEDVAITGFDDFDFAKYIDPPLTTVAIPGYEMGQTGADLLISSLTGQAAARERTFPVELCMRESA